MLKTTAINATKIKNKKTSHLWNLIQFASNFNPKNLNECYKREIDVNI